MEFRLLYSMLLKKKKKRLKEQRNVSKLHLMRKLDLNL